MKRTLKATPWIVNLGLDLRFIALALRAIWIALLGHEEQGLRVLRAKTRFKGYDAHFEGPVSTCSGSSWRPHVQERHDAGLSLRHNTHFM